MRTLDELQDGLDSDLAWRRTELQALKSQGRSASGAARDALCRAGVALLYAHWEGYVKYALSSYFRFVAVRKLTYGELHPSFVAKGVEHAVARHGLSDTELQTARVAWILDAGPLRSRFPGKDGVDTRSNLNSETWRDLLLSLGLSSSLLETKRHLIDYSLLRARNEIAHGRYAPIQWEAYDEMHDEILGLLAEVKTLVLDSADAKRYRRDAD